MSEWFAMVWMGTCYLFIQIFRYFRHIYAFQAYICTSSNTATTMSCETTMLADHTREERLCTCILMTASKWQMQSINKCYMLCLFTYFYTKKKKKKKDKKKKEKAAYIILTFPQDYEQSVQQYKLNWCPELNWCLAVWIWVCMSWALLTRLIYCIIQFSSIRPTGQCILSVFLMHC